MKKYKIWIEIEEMDEDDDYYSDIGEPVSCGLFDTLEEAVAFQNEIRDSFSSAV
ncbi:MAG: hypothetical protein P4L51_24195 [Puia sp.]|nr:hypothetical protein [Puia sp.]